VFILCSSLRYLAIVGERNKEAEQTVKVRMELPWFGFFTFHSWLCLDLIMLTFRLSQFVCSDCNVCSTCDAAKDELYFIARYTYVDR